VVAGQLQKSELSRSIFILAAAWGVPATASFSQEPLHNRMEIAF
jgi:hypothetical protein